MQYDMHYYGTYAMAAAAGLPKEDAQVVATAAQFVDDQAVTKWVLCQTQEGILGVATAHHPLDAGRRTFSRDAGTNDTRSVWVPFHFLPGNEGASFEHRMVCRKDSAVARRMLDYYLSPSVMREHRNHALHLMGITAHVYADTFSHYGFSGIPSDLNMVDEDSIQYDGGHTQGILEHIRAQAEGFMARFGNAPRLGHGGALTNPDRPYLQWSFDYAHGERSKRDNRTTFLEACKALYERFVQFSALYYENARTPLASWEQLQAPVREIIGREGAADERAGFWMEAMREGRLQGVEPCEHYSEKEWLATLEEFERSDNPEAFSKSHAYRFFVAADYHRNYVLKRLLPGAGLLVA